MEISIELRELQPFLNERGQLKNWPAKKKRKVLALWYLAGQFIPKRRSTHCWMNGRSFTTLPRCAGNCSTIFC